MPEARWRSSFWRRFGRSFDCFNPCCAGTGSPAGLYLAGLAAAHGFQSLLCWNWLPGMYAERAMEVSRNVSILVVLELATRPSPRAVGGSSSRSFNPCCAGTGYPARFRVSELVWG